MKNNVTRLKKITAITKEANALKWCYVNADNEFKFVDQTFIIDKSVEEYKVHKKYDMVEEYTNEAYMEEILVVITNDNQLKFYNQNYDHIESSLVKVKE